MYSLPQSLTLAAGMVTGLAVRPRERTIIGSLPGVTPGTSASIHCCHHCQPHPQALVFGSSEIRELNWGTANGNAGRSSGGSSPQHQQAYYWLGPVVQPSMALNSPRCTVYEPTTDCVLFVDQYGIASLDSRNVVGLVAGNRFTQRPSGSSCDGAAEAARFLNIVGLAPDGKGNVYIAEPDRIRKLDLPSRIVTTLPDSAPQAGTAWVALTYDAVADRLFVATAKAICRIDVTGGGGSDDPRNAATIATSNGTAKKDRETIVVRLVAGDWATAGFTDGSETLARFNKITAVLAGAGGCLYILDYGNFRIKDANGFVSTAYANLNTNVSYLTVLPNGDLLLGTCGSAGFSILTGTPALAPSSDTLGGFTANKTRRQPSPMVSELYGVLMPSPINVSTTSHAAAAAAAADKLVAATGTSRVPNSNGGVGADRQQGSHGGDDDSSGPSSAAVGVPQHSAIAAAAGIVTVRAGPGGALVFGVHRSALLKRSEYFRYLLNPGGGFADNGSSEVTLADADPEALRWLLAYMYCGELYVPDELLRPAAVLADRLLLPAVCTSALQEWLLAGVTPGSVVSDLIWAERRGLAPLVAQLKAYLLRYRRQADQLDEMVAQAPELAAEVMQHMALAV